MNIIFYIIAFAGPAFAIGMLVYLIVQNKAKKAAGASKAPVFTSKKKKKNYSATVYRVTSGNRLTKPFLRNIEYKLIPLYPANNKSDDDYTKSLASIILKCVGMSIAAVLIIWGINPGIYTFVSGVFVAYVFSTQIISNSIKKEEINFLTKLDAFLGNIKHYFYQTNSIRNTLLMVQGVSDKKMKMIAEELYDVLSAEDENVERRKYMSSSRNKYLKLFLSFAERVDEDGDTIDEKDGSIFLHSVMQIRSDVQDERRYITDKMHNFKMLGVVCGGIIVAVPYVASWAISTLPGLNSFYIGRFGNLIKLGLLLLSFVCYKLVHMLQNDKVQSQSTGSFFVRLSNLPIISTIVNWIVNRNPIETAKKQEKIRRIGEHYTVRALVMKQILCGIGAVIVTFFVLITGHDARRYEIINETASIDDLSETADGRQIEALKKHIPVYVQRFVDQKATDIDPAELAPVLYNEAEGLRSEEVCADAAREISSRVNEYNNEEFDFLDIVVILILAVLSYIYPSLAMDIRATVIENKMQDEVIQFQSLINMQAKVPGMTAVSILESMEQFASVFKLPIQQCINEYRIDDIAALQRLYVAERYPGFRKIIDNFMMIDEVGVETAFEEVSSEIENFREDRKLEKKILLEDETMLASMVAVIPAVVIMFGYLLVPFMVKTMSMFNEYTAQLGKLAGGGGL